MDGSEIQSDIAKEKQRRYAHEWYLKNKEKTIKRSADWSSANRDRVKELYATNAPRVNAIRGEKSKLKRALDPGFAKKEVDRLKSWGEKNKAKARAASNAWRKRNIEKVRAQRRVRYAANPEKSRAATESWRVANPGKAAGVQKRYRSKRPATYMLSVAKTRARKLGREFTLTEEWIKERLPFGCALSGIQFDMSPAIGKGKAKPLVPSIDRIDSDKGYCPDNCRLICWALNGAIKHWGWNAIAYILRAAVENEPKHRGISLFGNGR